IAAAVAAGGCCLLTFLIIRRHQKNRRRLHDLPSALQSAIHSDCGFSGAGIVVTGAGAGLGAELIKHLLGTNLPALIVGTNRPMPGCQDSIEDNPDEVLRRLFVDFGDVKSIRQFADRLTELFRQRGVRLSHLVCNAGVFFPAEPLSRDGLPMHLAVNFIANVELVRLLLGNGLLEPGYTRVLLVSSSLSSRGVATEASTLIDVAKDVAKDARRLKTQSSAALYANSKQCLNLLAQHLHKNLGVHACAAFTGGPVATRLLRPPWIPRFLQAPFLWLLSLVFQSPEVVAADLFGLMCRPDVTSGRVYSAGRQADWPLELPADRLAEFVADYERLLMKIE
ncbi:hypothetical protein BOX15_Mlig022825g1, partial [Macrostomum lignano]